MLVLGAWYMTNLWLPRVIILLACERRELQYSLRPSFLRSAKFLLWIVSKRTAGAWTVFF